MAENFDPRSHQTREFAPVNLLGKCKRCRKAYRKAAQPGYADFGPADRGCSRGPRLPAFRFDTGEIVQAYGLQHAQGAAIRCICNQAWVVLQPIVGRYSPTKACNGVCMSATGPTCDCQCKGENHGGRHAC